MSISRKEFFRQGFFSLGKTALDIVVTLKGGEVVEDDGSRNAVSGEPRPDLAATSFNERCLARNCGCFACVERCQSQAIMVVPAEGIRIDETRCTGCGTCEYICPVSPKAVIVQPRSKPVG
ncbi:MAG: 4Fe-4S binding protein [Geobacteraceae bacterium]|nr:4Fe-4S binding protein [Geobacteraceae bacterium]